MAKPAKQSTSLYLDVEVNENINRKAKETGKSKSEVVNELLKGETTESNKEKPMIIVTSSHKGGVAKTITAANLAVELAIKGKKTLIIDLDGQGSISEYLHVYDGDNQLPCIADVMIADDNGEEMTLAQVKRPAMYEDDSEEFHEIENLEVVPSDLRFDNADSKMKNSGSMAGIDTRLHDAIEDLLQEEEYDYIIIDCPPRVDLVTTNAITALRAGKPESMVIVPVRPDGFSKRGMESTVSAIEAVGRKKRTYTSNWMLLRTIDEPRTNLSKILEETIMHDFPHAKFLETKIEKAVVVMESSQFYTPLAYYAENSKSRSQYIALADEIEAIVNGN